MMWLNQLLGALGKPFQWWIILAPWERAVCIRGGKRRPPVGPGVHFRIPFWDRWYIQSVRRRTLDSTGITATTCDGKSVTVNMGVEFAIADLERLLDNLASPDATICCRCEGAISVEINRLALSEISADVLARAGDTACPWDDWGLAQGKVFIRSLATVRAFRLIQGEYRSYTGLVDLDDPTRRRGE